VAEFYRSELIVILILFVGITIRVFNVIALIL